MCRLLLSSLVGTHWIISMHFFWKAALKGCYIYLYTYRYNILKLFFVYAKIAFFSRS